MITTQDQNFYVNSVEENFTSKPGADIHSQDSLPAYLANLDLGPAYESGELSNSTLESNG
jgi:hypothetical protein